MLNYIKRKLKDKLFLLGMLVVVGSVAVVSGDPIDNVYFCLLLVYFIKFLNM